MGWVAWARWGRVPPRLHSAVISMLVQPHDRFCTGDMRSVNANSVLRLSPARLVLWPPMEFWKHTAWSLPSKSHHLWNSLEAC